MLLQILLITCFSTHHILGYRILAYLTVPGTGHHNVFAPIVYELGKRGHQVVYVTSVESKFSHENVEVRLVPPFMEKIAKEYDFVGTNKMPAYRAHYEFYKMFRQFADEYFGDPLVKELIHSNETYDAVLLESHLYQEPASALIHRFGCVGIELASLGDIPWLNEITGLPDNPAYQMSFLSRYTDSMTFTERLHNFIDSWLMTFVSYYKLNDMQRVMDKYFNYPGWEDRPPIHRLLSNRSMVLVNRDHVLGYPAPTAPHVKNIGGLNIVPNKPLPKDLQKFMDEASDGVIYFSLGSIVKTSEMTSGTVGKAFMSVFRQLPQRILIKWESDVRPDGLPDNIKTAKWFPQQDVLAHKNCVGFVTHGGLQSTTEAVYNGVPIVGIPFFGDQPKNVIHAKTSGYGIHLDYENITQTSVSWALNEIIHNPRYKEEAVRRSNMLKDRRHTSLDEAVYWIEYGIKYPNALTPRGAYLTFVQLHMIDVHITIILAVCIFIYLSYFVLSRRLCTRRTYNTKEKLS